MKEKELRKRKREWGEEKRAREKLEVKIRKLEEKLEEKIEGRSEGGRVK